MMEETIIMEINGLLCHDHVTANMKPRLSFDERRSYTEWREEIKVKLTELLGLDVIAENAVTDPQMQIVEEEQKDGYRQIRFEFESEVGSVVPCYILIPDGLCGKAPVVITLQGHNKSGFHSSIADPICHETLDYDLGRGAFAVQAVKSGFIGVAIDQRGMGERKAMNSLVRRVSTDPASGSCYYEATSALMLGRTLIGERAWDIMRTIDLLPNFAECDTEKIAITGNSGGGTASYYAACMDDRIKICAPSCAFCPYPESILKFYHCSCNYIPNAYRYFDMQDLSCLIAPRRLAIVSGEYDTGFLIKGVKKGYETVERIYKAAGAADNCSLTVNPTPHFWSKDVMWELIGKEFALLEGKNNE